MKGYEVVDTFIDNQASGKDFNRPNWSLAKDAVARADAIVCTKLDRFGRSIKHIREEIDALGLRGKGLITTDGTIDTTQSDTNDMSAAFRSLTLNILGSIAEFERALINERTRSGRVRAKERGVKFGRPITDLDEATVKAMRRDNLSLKTIAAKLGCSPRTVGRALERFGDPKKTVTVIKRSEGVSV